MLTQQEWEKIMAAAERVEPEQYTRNMSVRRQKTMRRLFLLAAAGVPAVSLSIPHDMALLLINILIHDVAAKEGKLQYDPCRILAAAWRRTQSTAAGARICPPRWVVRCSDNARRWWWIPADLVTMDATAAHFELEPDDCKTAGRGKWRPARRRDKGAAIACDKGGVPPRATAARAGEDTAHA